MVRFLGGVSRGCAGVGRMNRGEDVPLLGVPVDAKRAREAAYVLGDEVILRFEGVE